MNNDRSVSGERRESHNVTLQWCSRGQSQTPALISREITNKNGGGICILVNDRLNYIEKQYLDIFNSKIFESCFIEITCKNERNVIVGSLYRSRGASEVEFLNIFTDQVRKLNTERKEMVIGTDQNIDLLKYLSSHSSVAMLNKITEFCLLYHKTNWGN